MGDTHNTNNRYILDLESGQFEPSSPQTDTRDSLATKLDGIIKARLASNRVPSMAYGQGQPQSIPIPVPSASAPVSASASVVSSPPSQPQHPGLGPRRLISTINSTADVPPGPFLKEKRKPQVPTTTGFPEYIFPGICMSDIARDANMTLGGISRIFNGKRKPLRATLQKLADLYTGGNTRRITAIIAHRCRALKEREAARAEEERLRQERARARYAKTTF